MKSVKAVASRSPAKSRTKQPTQMGKLAEAHPKSRSRRLSRIIGGGRPHTIIVRRDKDVPWGAKIELIDIIERGKSGIFQS